jgi:transcriptional regulator with XRE-family HTH domain
MEDLAERLYRARVATGMNQRDFADRLGISLRTLRNFEAGRFPPKLKDIRSYVDVTGRSFDYFLSSEGTPS